MAGREVGSDRESSKDEDNDGSSPLHSTSEAAAPTLVSEELDKFYKSHGLDVSAILTRGSERSEDKHSSPNILPYRFIRLNPRYDKRETLDLLANEVTATNDSAIGPEKDDATDHFPIRVPWLDERWGFYALPKSFSLATSPCFKSGRAYGMDVSSGACVAALLTDAHDVTSDCEQHKRQNSSSPETLRFLDLCCCPGLKLCAIADFAKANTKGSTVVGVDVSETRLSQCKRIVEKYHVDPTTSGAKDKSETSIRLYCQDGTTFGSVGDTNLMFESGVAYEGMLHRGKRKRMNKSARARERKRLKSISTEDAKQSNRGDQEDTSDSHIMTQMERFDHVLVDAECSTDGSLKHLEKWINGSCESTTLSNQTLTDTNKLADLVTLQRKLIASGFRLLKPGGTMVYSTCSLSHEQNESIVSWLLSQEPTSSVLIPLSFPLVRSKLMKHGSLKGTVRFYPNASADATVPGPELMGDGFFLAKIGKRR